LSASSYIGLMSGTSLDGVDGVIVAIPDNYSGGVLSVIADAYVPFDETIKKELLALQKASENEIERALLSANQLAFLYTQCVSQLLGKANLTPKDITAIGAHGQTIRHRPERGYTYQINNPSLLAELTQINVIADFRNKDIAAGGQGAPFVPAFHQAVFSHPEKTRVILNIGGIANISILPAGGKTYGFDTGPGNVLLDAWIRQNLSQNYDKDGEWAASGTPDMVLLEAMLEEPYFSLPPPKSTGRDVFNLEWVKAILNSSYTFSRLSPVDVQATLALFTATSIVNAIRQSAPSATHVYASGGGARNVFLMSEIQRLLNEDSTIQVTLDTTDVVGLQPQYVEALAFAWLAYCFIQKQPGNLPEVTGAKGSRILGAFYPAN